MNERPLLYPYYLMAHYFFHCFAFRKIHKIKLNQIQIVITMKRNYLTKTKAKKVTTATKKLPRDGLDNCFFIFWRSKNRSPIQLYQM